MDAAKSTEGNGSIVYSFYVVAILMAVYVLSFMDRILLSLLVKPIRQEFQIGDTGMGLLMGFGFALFYTSFGLLFGAIADRYNRRNLILAGLLGWSIATCGGGLAMGLGTLMFARAIVGVGEGSLAPGAYSTIGDRFSPERQGLAIGIYSMGVGLGGGLSMVFGGALVHWAGNTSVTLPLLGTLTGWRLAMVTMGALGFPLAALFLATVREAPRKARSIAPPPFSEVLRMMARRWRAFGGALVGFSCAVVSVYIPYLWVPALFARSHAMNPQEIGGVLGVVLMISGVCGVVGAGALSDKLLSRGMADAPVRTIFWAALVQMPILGLAYIVPDRTTALVLLAIGMVLTSASSSLQATALTLMTPGQMRGRMMSIHLLVITVVGLGLAPLFTGLLSDHVFTQDNGLGRSLAMVSTIALAICCVALALSRAAIQQVIVERRAAAEAA